MISSLKMNKLAFLFVVAFCGSYTSSVDVKDTNRIFNGLPATNNQFPYMVSLQLIGLLNNYTRGHRCGGALVTQQHVVTAASCIFNNLNGVYTQLDPNDYRVFAGAAVLTNDTSADRHRRVESFTVNPGYRPGTPYVNDIAVIKLVDEFPNNVVRPVPLSETDDTAQQLNACVYSGWGSQNTTASASTQLMYVQKTVMDQQVCTIYYSREINITNSMICAISNQIYSSCTGDNGNPLVCNNSLNGILIQSSNTCSPTSISILPELYTRISSFRPWINTVTSGVSILKPGMALVIAVVRILTAYVLN